MATNEDINQIAARTVEQTTKHPAAVELGRLGGKKGGPARAAKLSKKRKKEIAKNAAAARWNKVKLGK